MTNIVIVSAFRSAIANFCGMFSNMPAYVITSHIIKHILQTTQVDPESIDQVIIGHVLISGLGQNTAKQASVLAGIPHTTTATVVNQVCGSGLKSIMIAYQSIVEGLQHGENRIILAGGQENMTQVPHSMHLRSGIKLGNELISDLIIKDGLTDVFENVHMGITAEYLAKKFKISRNEQDEFACMSQHKAEIAQKQHKFKNEIVPITIKKAKQEDVLFDYDEFIKANTTLLNLSKLKPAFIHDDTGTVTAGNASGINDGAAMVMLMTEDEAKKRNLKPIATIKSFAQTGIQPMLMGLGPINAVNKALKIANWNINDIERIELNEAFAAQVIAVNKEIGWNVNKVNINGGAIALGHPIGASGARIIVTLLHGMLDSNSKRGIATLCVGGGAGIAMCLEM